MGLLLFIKMQHYKIPFKGGSDALGQIAEGVSHALARTKAWDNHETADTFLFQDDRFKLAFEFFYLDQVVAITVNTSQKCLHRLQIT